MYLKKKKKQSDKEEETERLALQHWVLGSQAVTLQQTVAPHIPRVFCPVIGAVGGCLSNEFAGAISGLLLHSKPRTMQECSSKLQSP